MLLSQILLPDSHSRCYQILDILVIFLLDVIEILPLLRHWRWRKSARNSVGTGATGGGGAGGTGGRCLQQLILDVTVRLSLTEVTGCDRMRWGVGRLGESQAISAKSEATPSFRSLQSHKVQLMAKQALALGSLLVGFAGESLASSSHGFQSCSHGTP